MSAPKGLNLTAPASKNKFRFASTTQLSKQTSASLTKKRNITQRPSGDNFAHDLTVTAEGRRIAEEGVSSEKELFTSEGGEDESLKYDTFFASELQRLSELNNTTEFGKIYRAIFPLTRSLPEVLFNKKEIFSILKNALNAHVLHDTKHLKVDALRLLAVLSRDLASEFLPFLDDSIKLIVGGLDSDNTSETETSFIVLRYILSYNQDYYIHGMTPSLPPSTSSKSDNLKEFKSYYGPLLSSRKPYIRRLTSEVFSTILRRTPRKNLQLHIRSLLKTLIKQTTEKENDRFTAGKKKDATYLKDGASCLLFEIVKGINFQLHSKEAVLLPLIFNCLSSGEYHKDTNEKGSEDYNHQVLQTLLTISKTLLLKICRHLEDWQYAKNLIQYFYSSATNAFKKHNSDSSDTSGRETYFYASLLKRVLGFRSGNLLMGYIDGSPGDNNKSILGYPNNFMSLVVSSGVLKGGFYWGLSEEGRSGVLELVVQCWRTEVHYLDSGSGETDDVIISDKSDDDDDDDDDDEEDSDTPTLTSTLPSLLQTLIESDTSTTQTTSLYLSQNLLPILEKTGHLSVISSVLLRSASILSKTKPVAALLVLNRVRSFAKGKKGTGDLVFVEDDELYSLIVKTFEGYDGSEEGALLLALNAISLIKPKTNTLKSRKSLISAMWSVVNTASMQDNSKLVYLCAIIGELMSVCFDDDDKNNTLKFINQLEPIINKLLSSSPSSSSNNNSNVAHHPSVLKATSDFYSHIISSGFKSKVTVLNTPPKSNNDTERFIISLIPNLSSFNHNCRLFALEILSFLPCLNEVIRDNDDATDKCDVKKLDVFSALLSIEKSPLDIRTERFISTQLTNLHVLARTKKLPNLYAKSLGYFLMGVLSYKLSTLWPIAVACEVCLIEGYRDEVWGGILERVKEVVFLKVDNSADENESDSEDEYDADEYDADDVVKDDNGVIDKEAKSKKIKIVAENNTNDDDNDETSETSSISDSITEIVSRFLIQYSTPPSNSTDPLTYHKQIFTILEKTPLLVVSKCRIMVPIFIAFLQNQWFKVHPGDPDFRELGLGRYLDSFDENADIDDVKNVVYSRSALSVKYVSTNLISFLSVFAAINGPTQLIKSDLLLQIHTTFLANSDSNIGLLALKCIQKFKLSYLVPHHIVLDGLMLPGNFREALVSFNLDTVDDLHRLPLIVVLTRILFGRLHSKGAKGKRTKDTPATRRAAILGFFSNCKGEELDTFVFMMIRSFDSRTPLEALEPQDKNTALNAITTSIFAGTLDLRTVNMKRQVGFLNLLGTVLTKLGHKVVQYVPAFVTLLLTFVEYSTVETSSDKIEKMDVDGDEVEDTEEDRVSKSHASAVRTLAFKRLGELFGLFCNLYDFEEFAGRLWSSISSSLEKLPSTVISNSVKIVGNKQSREAAPALLLLLETFSEHKALISMLIFNENSTSSVKVIPTIVSCISPTSSTSSLEVTLKFIENLLTTEDLQAQKVNKFSTRPVEAFDIASVQLIASHIKPLVKQFVSLMSSSVSKFGNVPNKQLNILCKVCEKIIQPTQGKTEAGVADFDSETLTTITNLLIPFLNPKSVKKGGDREESVKLNILSILNSFIPLLSFENSLSNLASLSRLLGPTKNKCGTTSVLLRAGLVKTISCMAQVPGMGNFFVKMADAVSDLNAMNPKRMDEIDFEKVIPVLNLLGNDTKGWRSFVDPESDYRLGVKCILPLAYSCLHAFYDKDGVIVRGAFKAMKVFVNVCAASEDWILVLLNSVLPAVKLGLTSHDDGARKLFVLLIRECAINFQNHPSPHLFGDMIKLVRTDDEEVDFFFNITHVQVHRRGRALNRLRKLLNGNGKEKSDSADDVDTSMTEIEGGEGDGKGDGKGDNDTEMELATPAIAKSIFTPQTLNFILMPLAVHPIFESTKNTETQLALEGVATVGAIAKHLQWGRYLGTLNNFLTQISRNTEQEKYLIGAVCSVLDAFHFDLDNAVEEPEFGGIVNSKKKETVAADEEDGKEKSDSAAANDDDAVAEDYATADDVQPVNIVWKALQKLIPRITKFLIIEVPDKKSGQTIKTLRSPIALALLKLFQKLPQHLFESKLSGLLLTVCQGLKSRDSTAREIARTTISRMAISLGARYLRNIVHEMSISLGEGYQLHVRAAALHSVIYALSKDEKVALTLHDNDWFDRCVPSIMDLVQQDVFGTACEMKEVQDAQRRVMKEAMGVKSFDTLEILCRLINFRPASTTVDGTELSSVHMVIMPLVERLKVEGIDTNHGVISKVRTCLERAVSGFGKNEDMKDQEILLFVHATIGPFIDKNKKAKALIADDSSDEDDGDEFVDSADEGEEFDSNEMKITSRKKSGKDGKMKNADGSVDKKVNSMEKKNEDPNNVQKKKRINSSSWLPSDQEVHNKTSAIALKTAQHKAMHKVLDGENAPKLTGHGRHGKSVMAALKGLFNPAVSCAVVFGLQLLHTSLKKSKLDVSSDIIKSMAAPYVPMLSRCVKRSGQNDIVLLSIKCLNFFLRMELDSIVKSKKMLSGSCLRLLTMGGAGGSRDEVIQGCFKALTFLMSDNSPTNTIATMLNPKQLRALVALLHGVVHESHHHTATFALIKCIVNKKVLNLEVYELMETVLGLTCQSLNENIRISSCQIFMTFLVNYPLAEKVVEGHLKQLIQNLGYEYEDGRASATTLVKMVIDKLPVELLDKHCGLVFLPLVLQLANESSTKCKEIVGICIQNLFRRISVEVLSGLHGYLKQWLAINTSSQGDEQQLKLRNCSMQLLGLIIESQPNYILESKVRTVEVRELIIKVIVEEEEEGNKWGENWEGVYFSMICFEKIQLAIQAASASKKGPKYVVDSETFVPVWGKAVKTLAHYHPWVKLVSGRVVGGDFSAITQKNIHNSWVAKIPGSGLYELGKSFCSQLDIDDKFSNNEIVLTAIRGVSMAVNAMRWDHDGSLCFKEQEVESDEEEEEDGEESDGDDDEGEETERKEKKKNMEVVSKADEVKAIKWVFNRLNGIAKKSDGGGKRHNIFKCFAALMSNADLKVDAYLELILSPLHRALTEAENVHNATDDEVGFMKDLVQLCEDKCGTEHFMKCYAAVKTLANERKLQRKNDLAIEKINDPVEAAKKRITKQQKELLRKKRRMEEKKSGVGRPQMKKRKF